MRKRFEVKKFWVFLLLLVFVHPASGDQVLTASPGLRIELKKYGISFARLPGWHFIQTSPRGKKLFDLIKVFPSSDSVEQNLDNLYEALAARAYMIADPRSEIGPSGAQYAKQIVNEIKKQGYEVKASRATRENDIPILSYTLHYQVPRGSRERDIWLSLRFFLTPEYLLTFYGSARSQKELSELGTLFSTLQFLTNQE